MNKMPLSLLRVAAFCLPLGLVTSCGSGSEAVQGTVITINPSETGQPSGTAGSGMAHYTVVARSPTGYGQSGIVIAIGSPYLVFDGQPDYSCDNAAPPVCTLFNTRLPPPIQVTTDGAGTYDVTVLYDWTANADGTVTALDARSGTSYGIADITFVPPAAPPAVP